MSPSTKRFASPARFPSPTPFNRSGFTVVETLVSIAIIGLLLAILLPAVQSARQAAARMTCQNRIRQVVLAAHMYEEAFKVFPMADRPFVALLPFLDQSALHQKMVVYEPVTPNVETYLCPSDPRGDLSQGQVSYFINDGSGWAARLPPDYNIVQLDGARPSFTSRSRLSDFTDGTSQTAFYSERKIVTFSNADPTTEQMAQAEPNRYQWYVDRHYAIPNELDEFREACRQRRVNATPQVGTHFQLMFQQGVGYNHAVTPNSPGCHNNTSADFETSDSFYSLRPATSYHPGLVSVAFVDGHVRFVSDNIDSVVWTAISTRKGADYVGDF